MDRSIPKFLYYISIAIVVVIIDQWTKHIAYERLFGQSPIDALPILQWVLVFNRGAAFGFLNDSGGMQHYFFVGLASIISVILLIWLWRSVTENRLLSWGLTLVFAGAIGNLISRLLHQFIIDFIYFHYQDWYFPAFNIADTAITLGAICLIADAFGLGPD